MFLFSIYRAFIHRNEFVSKARLIQEIHYLIDHFFKSRSVYDNGIQQQFLGKLDERIKTHDREIERMCNYHYQGFVESVNELIKVRSDARTLKVC